MKELTDIDTLKSTVEALRESVNVHERQIDNLQQMFNRYRCEKEGHKWYCDAIINIQGKPCAQFVCEWCYKKMVKAIEEGPEIVSVKIPGAYDCEEDCDD